MSSINKISFGNNLVTNNAQQVLMEIPPYSSNDEYYRKSVQELDKAQRKELIKNLWPKASPEEIEFSTKDLEYMETQHMLKELEAPIERSFKIDLFVYNIIDKFNRMKKNLFRR